MVGPLRGGEVITTSCSAISSAIETPRASDTRFSRSPTLDLLSAVLGGVFFVVVLDLLSDAGLDGGVFFPVESWGAGNTGSSSSSISLSSVGETASAATDSSTAVLVNGASTVALRCLCLVLVLLDGCGSEVAVFGTGLSPACARIAVSKACTLASTGEEEAGCALLGELERGKDEQDTAAASSLTLGLAVVGTEWSEEVEA